jgi:hypothetical protein
VTRRSKSSDPSVRTDSIPADSLPVATTVQFCGLRGIVNDAWSSACGAGEPDPRSALIVSTKRHSAFGQLAGQFDPRHDPTVYLVQMVGNFSCRGRCSGRNATGPSYRVLSIVFDPMTGQATDDGLTAQPGDLTLMGTAYRLPPPAEVR